MSNNNIGYIEEEQRAKVIIYTNIKCGPNCLVGQSKF